MMAMCDVIVQLCLRRYISSSNRLASLAALVLIKYCMRELKLIDVFNMSYKICFCITLLFFFSYPGQAAPLVENQDVAKRAKTDTVTEDGKFRI
jgi:hypothetical protein